MTDLTPSPGMQDAQEAPVTPRARQTGARGALPRRTMIGLSIVGALALGVLGLAFWPTSQAADPYTPGSVTPADAQVVAGPTAVTVTPTATPTVPSGEAQSASTSTPGEAPGENPAPGALSQGDAVASAAPARPAGAGRAPSDNAAEQAAPDPLLRPEAAPEPALRDPFVTGPERAGVRIASPGTTVNAPAPAPAQTASYVQSAPSTFQPASPVSVSAAPLPAPTPAPLPGPVVTALPVQVTSAPAPLPLPSAPPVVVRSAPLVVTGPAQVGQVQVTAPRPDARPTTTPNAAAPGTPANAAERFVQDTGLRLTGLARAEGSAADGSGAGVLLAALQSARGNELIDIVSEVPGALQGTPARLAAGRDARSVTLLVGADRTVLRLAEAGAPGTAQPERGAQ